MVCQCRFMDCHKCTTLVWDADGGEGDVVSMWGKGYKEIWELSVLSVQFCCEPKTSLTKSI